MLNLSCLSYSEGLFNFDEDLDIEAATEAEDYSPFPQSSDDDETSTSTDGMWGCGLQVHLYEHTMKLCYCVCG